jgi:hypothetical protein
MSYKVNSITLYNKIFSLCYIKILSLFFNVIIILDLSLFNYNNGNDKAKLKKKKTKIFPTLSIK